MTEVAVGVQGTTTSSKETHGKKNAKQQKRIKGVRSMIGFNHQHFPVL
jgi:hypothetical protein